METRSGLRAVHASFDSIATKLDALYAATPALSVRVHSAILAIWSRLSSDKILKDKLVKGGMLKKVLPLLKVQETRITALSLINLVSHHGGDESRNEVARLFCPTLVALMRAHPDNPRIVEPAIAAMAHALTSSIVGEGGKPADPALLKQIGLKDVLQATIDALQDPISSTYLVDHALDLLASATHSCQKECRAVTDFWPMLAAFLGSKDPGRRCTSLSALVRSVFDRISDQNVASLDPNKLIAAAQRSIPRNLAWVLEDYGNERCDMMMTLRSTLDYQKAMMGYLKDTIL